MAQLKSAMIGAIFTLILLLTIVLGLVLAQEVVAAEIPQPVIVNEIEVAQQFAPLTDAVVVRDISEQQFAPSVGQ